MQKQREIKFRVWLVDDEEMVFFGWFYGAFACANVEQLDNNKIIAMQYTGLKDKNRKEVYEGDIVKYEKAPPIKTGPIDKESGIAVMDKETSSKQMNQNATMIMGQEEKKELTEREKIQSSNDFWDSPKEVRYVLCYWQPFAAFLPIDPREWEIIGNIYENPELLKVNPIEKPNV